MIAGWFLVCWASIVLALPEITLQVNSQVPAVARVSEAYEFTFTASTFQSSYGAMSYSLLKSPPWLHLDNSTRKLYGTPEPKDVGSSRFQLVATDLSGSSGMEVTFVTLDGPGLRLADLVLPQLSQFGPTSDPDTLFLHPLQYFSFSFSKETFSSTTNDIVYYATTDDASPLPSWLQFDAKILRFYGTTPSLVSSIAMPQIYGLKLYASRVVGFAEATVTFHLAIGYHTLAFQTPFQTINISRGDTFSVSLKDQLCLDGKPIQNLDLNDVRASVPDWVKFDPRSISFEGKVPAASNSVKISVTATDFYNDLAAATVSLNILGLFTGPLPTVNATAGQPFNYSINYNIIQYDDVRISAQLGDASSWLQYDEDHRAFQGVVPRDITSKTIAIRLHAVRGPVSDDETLKIRISGASSSPTLSGFSRSSSLAQTHTMSTTVTPSEVPTSDKGDNPGDSKNRLELALLIALPTVCAILVAMVLLVCWRRKKARRERHKYFVQKDNKPRLVAQEFDTPDISEIQGEPAARSLLDEKELRQSAPAPRIDLPWTDSATVSEHHLSRISLEAEGVGPTKIDSAPAMLRDQLHRQRVNNRERSNQITTSQEPFNFSRKRLPFKSLHSRIQSSRISKSTSRPLSGFSTYNFGFPTRRSGAGHGSGGPPGFNEVRQSWQFTGSSPTSEDSRILSVDLDKFPQPPPEVETQRGRENENLAPEKEPSMRLIDDNSAYAEYLRNRRRDKYLEPSARFSTMNSTRRFSDRRVANAYLRSSRSIHSFSEIADCSTSDSANWRQPGASQSSGKTPSWDTGLLQRSPSSRLAAGPLNSLGRASVSNSGRISSIESISDSEWEDDLLVESQDPGGKRRWYPSDLLSEGTSSRVGSLETFRRSSRGQRGPLRARHPPTPETSGMEQASAQITSRRGREWKLGDSQEKQPVSIEKGQIQRSQGSEKGDLAFI